MVLTNEEIKNMYWYSDLSVDYIQKKTGLKSKDIRIISGNYESECPFCDNKNIYKNRTERHGMIWDRDKNKIICHSCYDLALKILRINDIITGYDYRLNFENNILKDIFNCFDKKGKDFILSIYNNIFNNLEIEMGNLFIEYD